MSNIAGVVLAAGGSSRLGQPKQLLTFRGETLIRRAVRAASDGGCNPVLVVVGENADAIRSELEIRDSRMSASPASGAGARARTRTRTPITIVENPEWRNGMGTSIHCALEQLTGTADAVVLLTCDQPFVDASIVRKLITEREKTGRSIVASSYAKTVGVPALFDRSLFDELRALPAAAGAKSLLEARRAELASIQFEEGAIDIDTPQDFERLKSDCD